MDYFELDERLVELQLFELQFGYRIYYFWYRYSKRHIQQAEVVLAQKT